MWEASLTPILRELRERLEVRRLIGVGDVSHKSSQLQSVIGPAQGRRKSRPVMPAIVGRLPKDQGDQKQGVLGLGGGATRFSWRIGGKHSPALWAGRASRSHRRVFRPPSAFYFLLGGFPASYPKPPLDELAAADPRHLGLAIFLPPSFDGQA